MTVLLAYIFYFIAASASPIQRRWLAVNRPSHEGQIQFAFHVTLVVVILSLLLPLFSPFHLIGNWSTLTWVTLVCGLFGAGFFTTSFVAQKHVEAGISTVISNIYTPITIFFATFLLGEALTPKQIGGTVLLLCAIVLVSKRHRIGRFRFDKYFLLMLLSGVFLAGSLTAERYLQKLTGFTAGTMLSWWAQCAALGLATIIFKSKTVYSIKDTVITGSFRYLQSLSYVILIFAVGNLSLVSAITTFKVVIIFIVGTIFLKEREDLLHKIIGSVIAVAGLLLMK